jgi:hypothetical protein
MGARRVDQAILEQGRLVVRRKRTHDMLPHMR